MLWEDGALGGRVQSLTDDVYNSSYAPQGSIVQETETKDLNDVHSSRNIPQGSEGTCTRDIFSQAEIGNFIQEAGDQLSPFIEADKTSVPGSKHCSDEDLPEEEHEYDPDPFLPIEDAQTSQKKVDMEHQDDDDEFLRTLAVDLV